MDNVKNYLSHLTPERKEWMLSLEAYAKEHRVPIMEPVSMHFLTQLVRIKEPRCILELGTAIGYSALRMHDAYPFAKITTIEKNDTMFQRAIQNIKEHEKEDQIEVLFGDAVERINYLIENEQIFDFVFIDAAKAQYRQYVEQIKPIVQKNGLIICDNILFKGYVADKNKTENPRFEKLAKKIRTFNEWLMQQEDFHTTIIPIGDGMSISIKIE